MIVSLHIFIVILSIGLGDKTELNYKINKENMKVWACYSQTKVYLNTT